MGDVRLSERKQRILRAVVDNYIHNPSPVASSEIQGKYLPEVSSATIRSELNALEELGYLVQPHVSAGRVPSALAYRHYVDTLERVTDNEYEVDILRSHFHSKIDEVEEVIRSTAKIISDVTNYTSVIVLGSVERVVVKEIKLVDIGGNSALVIIITDNGVLKDKMIDIPSNMTAKLFVTANGVINDLFSGRCLLDIIDNQDSIQCEVEELRGLFDEIVNMVSRYRDSHQNKVYLEGTDKIFGHKEYENIDNVKNFLSVINTKESITNLMDSGENIEMNIKIGKSEGSEENMAIVSARCFIGGKEVGHAGVIGPERMDYKKVISVLKSMSKLLNN